MDIDREVAWVRRRRTAGKVVPEVRLRALCEAWIEMFLRQAMVEFDDFFGALEVHSTRSEILATADTAEPQGTSALHLTEASFVHAAAGDVAPRVTACGVTLWGEPAARGRWQTDPSRRCRACAVHAASYGVLEEDPRWSAIMPGTHAPLAVAFGAGLLVGALDEAPLTISHKDLHASALHATYEAMAEEVATIMRELGEPWIRARLGDRYDQALATNRRRAVAPPFAARLTATDVAWMLETHAEHAGERQPSDALYRAVIGASRHGGLSPTTILMIDVAYSQVHAALTRAIGELRTGGSGAPVVGFLPTHLAGHYTSDFLELFADVCQTAHQKLVALPAGGRVNSTAEELAAFAILDSVAHAVDVHALSCETTGEIPLADWEKRDVLDDIAELLSSDTAYFFDDDARLLFRPPRDFDDRSGEEQLSQTSLHVSRWFEPFRPHETTDAPANDTH